MTLKDVRSAVESIKLAAQDAPDILWYAMTAFLIALGIAVFLNPYFEIKSSTAGVIAMLSWLTTAVLKVGLALLVLRKHETLGEIAVICAMVWIVLATVVSPPSSIELIVLTGEQEWGVAGREFTRMIILLAVFIGLGKRARS